MNLYKQDRYSVRGHAMLWRVDQYRPVAWLARALFLSLSVGWVVLSAAPGWAANPPDVSILAEPNSTKINSNCSNLGNLVTITQTVVNLGNDLPAHQDKLYVTEITNTYCPSTIKSY